MTANVNLQIVLSAYTSGTGRGMHVGNPTCRQYTLDVRKSVMLRAICTVIRKHGVGDGVGTGNKLKKDPI